jgi:hypothetical protein
MIAGPSSLSERQWADVPAFAPALMALSSINSAGLP